METQIQATVQSVTSVQRVRKADNQPFTLYEVKVSNGQTYSTSKRPIAEQAHALTGSLAILTVDEQVNGQWTNYYLNAIQGTQPSMTTDNGSITQPSITFTQPTTSASNSLSLISDRTAENDEKIWRQVATKVAAKMSANPSEFWQNVDNLIEFYRSGSKPEGVLAGAVSAQTDDIPF